jgi:catechol 2,3-dioxygenase-like lactoylglutathione lyase family enzyme
MTAAGGLRPIAPVFRVADLAGAIALYRDALGFELEGARGVQAPQVSSG